MRSITLTVFFDDPFWIGLFERLEDGTLTVCRPVFGSLPSDREIYDWLARATPALRFSPPVEQSAPRPVASNPKRRQRQIARALVSGTGTRSQQALAAARETLKTEHRRRRKALSEAEQAHKFQLRQEKKKAKHRGR